MQDNTPNDSIWTDIGRSILQLAIVGVLFWVTGWLVILITRLFIRPKRVPGPREGILVGLAVWWLVWSFGGFGGNIYDHPKTMNKEGYGCVVNGNRVTFVHEPKEEVRVCWQGQHRLSLKPHELDLHLLPDPKNGKVYYISHEPNKIVDGDFGDGEYISVVTGKRGNLVYQKHKETRHYRTCYWILTALILTGGFLGWMAAQTKALQDDGTS
jgi:hypothetical protein